MTKKLLVIVMLAAVNFQTTSCTSQKSQDDSAIVENADVEKIEAEDNFVTNPDAVTAESDPSLQAALGEAPPGDLQNLDVPTSDAKVDSVAGSASAQPTPDVTAAPTLDETSLSAMSQAEQPAPEILASADSAPSPTTETGMSEPPVQTADATPAFENSGTNSAMTNTGTTDLPAAPKMTGSGLKKIGTTIPYKAASGWVNAVYIARPGETIKDISQKIFSSDKSKDLKKIAENSYLKSRSVKPGDKIYYVSPNRPDDSTKTLLYYEDMGMVPETYVAKKGDTLKKVAKQILGFEKGSTELWAANSVESKGKLSEGEVLKYWSSASGVTGASIAQNTPQRPSQLIDAAQANSMPPPPQPQAQIPEPQQQQLPPPQNVAANTQPPPEMQMPPPPDSTASLPPPPPPPPAQMAPPPPPVEDLAAANPAPIKKKKNGAEEEAAAGIGGIDNDTLMSLGAVGVLTAALAFVLIRRKKKKAAEQAAMAGEMHIGS